MKAKIVLIWFFMVLALVSGFILAGCDSESSPIASGSDTSSTGDPASSTVTYSGTSDSISYTLVISPPSGKAVAVGYVYILTTVSGGVVKISTGIVAEILNNGFTFQPSYNNAPVFMVIISGSSINSITGIITFTDETTMQGPGAFDLNDGNGNNDVDFILIGLIDGRDAEAIISKSSRAAYGIATGDYYVIRFVEGDVISKGSIIWQDPQVSFIPDDGNAPFYGYYSGSIMEIYGIPYNGEEWDMGTRTITISL